MESDSLSASTFTVSLLPSLSLLFSLSRPPPIRLAAVPPSASLQTHLSKHEDFCPLYFKASTFAPPPVLNFLRLSLLRVEHLMLVSQWKASVVAFVISILSFVEHLFLKPTALISHASSLFAFMLALVIQPWVCISSSSSSAFSSAALCLRRWLVRWMRGHTFVRLRARV